jgi:hypothetical protein
MRHKFLLLVTTEDQQAFSAYDTVYEALRNEGIEFSLLEVINEDGTDE